MPDGKLKVVIATPERKVWEEREADAVMLPSVAGQLMVLPGHEPLMFLMDTGDAMIRVGDREEWFFVDKGFVEVLDDEVVVCPEVSEHAKEIDVERAKRALKRAEQRLASQAPDIDVARAEYALRRALYRLQAVERYSGSS